MILTDKGIFRGNDNGKFAPDEKLNRSHVLFLTSRLLGIEAEEPQEGEENYMPIKRALMAKKLTKGEKPEGDPEQLAEFLQFLANIIDLNTAEEYKCPSESQYSDLWFCSLLLWGHSRGWDVSNPAQIITRGLAAQMIQDLHEAEDLPNL